MKESKIQNKVRVAASDLGTRLFRANVGRGWTGNKVRRNKDGSITIFDPRPFHTGLPEGFSDTFGFTPVTITKEMVGKTVPVFTAAEVKTKTGRLRKKQKEFLEFCESMNCISGVVRSADDVIALISGAKKRLTRR